jgi:hypothetical protein
VGKTTTRVAKRSLLLGVSTWGLKNEPGPENVAMIEFYEIIVKTMEIIPYTFSL